MEHNFFSFIEILNFITNKEAHDVLLYQELGEITKDKKLKKLLHKLAKENIKHKKQHEKFLKKLVKHKDKQNLVWHQLEYREYLTQLLKEKNILKDIDVDKVKSEQKISELIKENIKNTTKVYCDLKKWVKIPSKKHYKKLCKIISKKEKQFASIFKKLNFTAIFPP